MNECGQCELFCGDLCVQVCLAWRRVLRELPGVNDRCIGVPSSVTGERGSLEARNPARKSLDPAEIGRYVCESRHCDTTRESWIETDIEKATISRFRDAEDVRRRNAWESGKEESDHALEVCFPRAHGHLTGISLRSNHGLLSVVTLCFKRVRACFLLSLPLGDVEVQRSDGGAKDVAKEVLVAVLVKHQLAS